MDDLEYTSERKELSVQRTLRTHEMPRSLFGRLGRPLVWIRTSTEPDRRAGFRWYEFLTGERFERIGAIRETFWCAPLVGDSHVFFRHREHRIIGSLTHRLTGATASLYAVFDSGLILWMGTQTPIWGISPRQMSMSGWIRYPADEAPEDCFEYFLKAVDHFTAQGHQLVDLTSVDELIALRGEYWRRQPGTADLWRLYGLLHALWLPLLLNLF